jgi:hypothetical protein
MKLILATLALLAVGAYGACPNGCSGHGDCHDKDMCACHPGFKGADCSLRYCPKGIAWVTTSQGDINSNGNRHDASVYSVDRTHTSNEYYVLDQASGVGGTWENWPSFFFQGGDEGHFYMECSNRGTCDSKTGECICFTGYTGESCRRTTCPNDCSGHGTCETVKTLSTGDGKTYSLWDGEKSRACKCDPGFTGYDCAERNCPYGDDPLTQDQQHETQTVRVYVSDGSSATFGGSVRLSYKDYFGETWETDSINVEAYNALTAQERLDTAADVKSKLEALPNDVLSGGVTVTANRCTTAVGGDGTISVTGTAYAFSTHTADADGSVYVCDGEDVEFTVDGAGAMTLGVPTDAANVICEEVLHSGACLELRISFSQPGNLQSFTVDTDAVTAAGAETTAQGATGINSAVGDSREILNTAESLTASYNILTDVTKVCAADACSVTKSTNIIVVDADGTDFEVGVRFTLKCGSKSLGIYTVATTSATDITTTEVPPDCDGAAGFEVKLYLVSEYWKIAGADLTGFVAVGDRLKITSWTTITPAVYKVWTNGDDTLIEFNGQYSDQVHVDDTNTAISFSGAGTSEANECSDRGLCNREVGECECFKGYAGNACGLQNALSA